RHLAQHRAIREPLLAEDQVLQVVPALGLRQHRPQVGIAAGEHQHALAQHALEAHLERRLRTRQRVHATPCSVSRCDAILLARSSAAGLSAGASMALTSGPDGPPASMRKTNVNSLWASARDGASRL